LSAPDVSAAPLITDWRTSITAELDSLDRWFSGRFLAELGLEHTPIPATHFLHPEFLREFIGGMVGLPSGEGIPPSRRTDFMLAIGASRFARWYASSLTAVALTGLANGVGLDVSPERSALTRRKAGHFHVSLDLAEDEILRCAERPTDWAVAGPVVRTLGELREYVWANLYGRNLKPVFTGVLQVIRVSEALLWTSAGEFAGLLADAADEYLAPERARPYAADRRALFEAATLPGVPGPSPLRDTLDYVPNPAGGYPKLVQTRRMCCLNYLLDLRAGRLCQNCPHLPLDERVALVRERHGVPVGARSGPAEDRAKEMGRRRASHQLIESEKTNEEGPGA
jgi:ferric iron reductase protein FhuF